MAGAVELSSGVEMEEIDCPEMTQFWGGLGGAQGSYRQGFVRFQPSGQVMPRFFANFEKKLTEFEVREDDVWISSFPKCGTTWTQEMVWNIVHGVDLETAKTTSLDKRVPFLELTSLMEPHMSLDMAANTLEQVEQLASPRVIKTHLAVLMLPKQVLEKKVKLIYVTRNPRDAVVSYQNHLRVMASSSLSLSSLLPSFLAGMAGYYSPFMEHVLDYWRLAEKDQVLFLTYEEMKRDLPRVIRKVAKFLGKGLTEEQVGTLATHLSFKNMKSNAAVNKMDMLNSISDITGEKVGTFMRKGEVGDWQNHLSKEQVEAMAAWEEEALKGTGLKFEHKLEPQVEDQK